jgi:hypothetical protein
VDTAQAKDKSEAAKLIETAKVVAAKKQLPGIPFYNHYGVCKQETVWLEPQTTLTLTVTADGGKPVTRTMTLNNRAFHDLNPVPEKNASSLVTSLNQAVGKHAQPDKDGLCPADVAKNWADVQNAYEAASIPETSRDFATDEANQILVRISNTADIGTAVDYSRVYYLNARSPLIGTGTVDAKLNADGTLGEGSASVDDETLGDVLTAAATVGSAGLTAWSAVDAARITGAATVQASAAGGGGVAPAARTAGGAAAKGPACKEADGWPEVNDSVEYAFAVAAAGFKHDHTRVAALETIPGGNCDGSSLGPVTGGSYTVSPIGGDGKPDKNAIGVNGTISLPKAADSAKPKP